MNLDTIISYTADSGGCSFHRMRVPSWMAQCQNRDLNIIDSHKLIKIDNFYQDVKMVRMQRQIDAKQCNDFYTFLKPLSDRYGFWINYEIDDVIGKEDLPKYNGCWASYQRSEYDSYIKTMIQGSDFLTVTCQELSNYYQKRFDLQKQNILIIPNYVAKWWISEAYSIERISAKYDSLKNRKPRICFPASLSHYDIYDNNNGVDDFTHIVDFIRSTLDKYEWIFFCGIPKQLKDVEDKIVYNPGFDLFNFPRELSLMNIDIIVSPLRDNIFNRCKSNLKFVESSAIGIPGVFQNLITYNKYTNSLFNDANDLQDQIDSILSSKDKYLDVVRHNRDIVDNGDSNSPNGWWLENNMDKWKDLYGISQRTIKVNLSKEINRRLERLKNGGINEDGLVYPKW